MEVEGKPVQRVLFHHHGQGQGHMGSELSKTEPQGSHHFQEVTVILKAAGAEARGQGVVTMLRGPNYHMAPFIPGVA